MTEIHSGQAYLDGRTDAQTDARTDARTDGHTHIHRTAIVATMSSSPQAGSSTGAVDGQRARLFEE